MAVGVHSSVPWGLQEPQGRPTLWSEGTGVCSHQATAGGLLAEHSSFQGGARGVSARTKPTGKVSGLVRIPAAEEVPRGPGPTALWHLPGATLLASGREALVCSSLALGWCHPTAVVGLSCAKLSGAGATSHTWPWSTRSRANATVVESLSGV